MNSGSDAQEPREHARFPTRFPTGFLIRRDDGNRRTNLRRRSCRLIVGNSRSLDGVGRYGLQSRLVHHIRLHFGLGRQGDGTGKLFARALRLVVPFVFPNHDDVVLTSCALIESRFAGRIATMQLRRLKRVAKRLIEADRLITTIVGKPVAAKGKEGSG